MRELHRPPAKIEGGAFRYSPAHGESATDIGSRRGSAAREELDDGLIP
jgi:hypothetical protein